MEFTLFLSDLFELVLVKLSNDLQSEVFLTCMVLIVIHSSQRLYPYKSIGSSLFPVDSYHTLIIYMNKLQAEQSNKTKAKKKKKKSEDSQCH